MRRFLAIPFALALGVLISSAAIGQTFNTTGTTTLSLSVAPEAALYVDTSSTALATTGSIFNPYTGTTNYTYKIRTTQSGGSGTIVLQVTSDFGGTGGPSVASPPSPGDALRYTCTVATPGSPCSGSQTASTTATTAVASFGADAHSTVAGNSGSVGWTLTNDPVYKTGSYSATVTFTVTAL